MDSTPPRALFASRAGRPSQASRSSQELTSAAAVWKRDWANRRCRDVRVEAALSHGFPEFTPEIIDNHIPAGCTETLRQRVAGILFPQEGTEKVLSAQMCASLRLTYAVEGIAEYNLAIRPEDTQVAF